MNSEINNEMTSVEVEVKFFDKEKHFGFFSLSGFPDVHVTEAVLRAQGFLPDDMERGVPAVVDVNISTAKPRLVRIHQIGEVLSRRPKQVVKPELKPLPAPMSETVYGIGDVVRARCTRGFDRRTPDFGFFKPENGGADIFVHYHQVESKTLSTICDNRDVLAEVVIVERGKKGWVGRISSVYMPVQPKVPVVQLAKVVPAAPTPALDKEKKRAEKLARQQALCSRQKLTVTAISDGKTYFGIPVTAAEWESVPAGTSVVLVEYFDQKTGHVSQPLEYFLVEKPGGKPTKKFQKVGVRLPTSAAEVKTAAVPNAPIQAAGVGFFKTEVGTLVTAPIYEPTCLDHVEQLLDMVNARIAIKKGATYRLGTVTEGGRLLSIAATLQRQVCVVA